MPTRPPLRLVPTNLLTGNIFIIVTEILHHYVVKFKSSQHLYQTINDHSWRSRRPIFSVLVLRSVRTIKDKEWSNKHSRKSKIKIIVVMSSEARYLSIVQTPHTLSSDRRVLEGLDFVHLLPQVLGVSKSTNPYRDDIFCHSVHWNGIPPACNAEISCLWTELLEQTPIYSQFVEPWIYFKENNSLSTFHELPSLSMSC